MDERDFFDKLSDSWDENECLSTPDKVNEILNYMDINEGDRVLDLGTGTGVLLPHIARKVGDTGKITAVDFSSGMLRKAQSKYGHISPKPEFLNLDIESDTIPGVFDKIILYCVYPHLHSPIETINWLNTVNLTDNGHLFIAFPCNEDFINNIHRERHSDSDILPSAETLSKFFNENGLRSEVLKTSPDTYIIKIYKK